MMRKYRNPFAADTITGQRKEPYLQVFLLGAAVILLIMLPVMILTGGYFIYYGDFNSQQLPFYHIAHEAVREGAFGWNWKTDLGVNFIGSYSFYLLGSPFFWVTALLPQRAVLYAMPYLLAAKHGFAAMTAFAYIRRFVRSRHAAMIGAMLYAYSGFQLFNIFFNHFQDVTAFFPLMLIAMEQHINENRRGVFALSVGLMALLNYYFFAGQAVFLVLYFAVRCCAPDFRARVGNFLTLAFEAVVGGLLAGIILLPSYFAVYANHRVGNYLTGMDMVAYSDRTRLWRIIQSFFMLPDVPARPNLFQSDFAKWASIGGYLPMFSMAGVIAFMSQKKKHWATRLTVICMICALVPTLNTMFHLFNEAYYARWYYMPVLIMALMTAYALDNPSIRWKTGLRVCALFLLGFGVISLLPVKQEDGSLSWFSFAQFPMYFWLVLGACCMMLYLCITVLRSRAHGWKYQGYALWMCVVSCITCTAMTVYFGLGLGMYPNTYVAYAIKGGSSIHVDPVENQFFRVDISEDYDNYPMFWGYSNMRCFHSVVPVSIMDFYEKIGVTRDVASRADLKHYPLRALFSVRYYFDKADADNADTESHTLDMPGFHYLKKENGFYIYENQAYLPMGIAYDHYADADETALLTSLSQEKTMLQALLLTPEQAERYGDILKKLDDTEKLGVRDEDYLDFCRETAQTRCCDTFSCDSYGFRATISLEKPQMVFFSVPYESGWTAEVNGRSVPVECVDYGFMAVRCEAGDNTVTFRYRTPGLYGGFLLTVGGAGLLVLYLLCAAVLGRKRKPACYAAKYCYDYHAAGELPLNATYARYSYMKSMGRLLNGEETGTPAPLPEAEPEEEEPNDE